MRNLLLFPFVLLLISTSLSADDAPLEKALGRIADIKSFEAKFEEKKTLAMMRIPLESKGRIFFSKQLGLLRITESGGKSKAWVQTKKVLLKEGKTTKTIPLEKGSPITLLVHSFHDVLLGNVARLKKNYDVQFEAGKKNWKLILVPRDLRLKKFLRRIEFSGEGNQVERMRMLEANGDETTTVFSSMKKRALSKSDFDAIF